MELSDDGEDVKGKFVRRPNLSGRDEERVVPWILFEIMGNISASDLLFLTDILRAIARTAQRL